MRIFSDPIVTRYQTLGHPESPARISNSQAYLCSRGLEMERPFIQATAADVLTVHSKRHWSMVQKGTYADPDTPHHEEIDRLALTSLSGALSAMESGLEGEPAFSLMRPPGHHAGRERIAGFCYINNMAVACAKALNRGKKAATLDIDVHHGDGTQDIAWGRADWLFASLHQSPLYPGTGLASQDNCLNFPLPPYTTEASYLPVLDKAIETILDFKPDVLGVSAGFDTYKECPIANFLLEKETYKKIGRRIADTKLKRFAVLEGGYAADLPLLIENFLEGFAG